MSSDIPRPIHLEVTVPYIALPSVTEQTGTDEAEAMTEQVYLLATGPSTQLVAGSWEKPATYTTRKGLFHLFQRTAELLPNTRYLLQILRPSWTSKPEELPSLPILTDEFAFSLVYHQAGSEEPKASIQAGSARIVIQLDEEGIPNSYRVDEVEG
ncbi:hypothetical protein KSF_069460 [Reticulibacter mediterranei]|uniref:Uncharacterized protein n=1 Tax=Reticulibacter mediterranei TaxID=2778369 RepID=A0A8J3IQT0_9CHLR|nr:hypothetical protein [Reticulibacter mediterranei]GHO96898.1 hypothetical protein KSF_069460 [Reticulibacter mediterranei]